MAVLRGHVERGVSVPRPFGRLREIYGSVRSEELPDAIRVAVHRGHEERGRFIVARLLERASREVHGSMRGQELPHAVRVSVLRGHVERGAAFPGGMRGSADVGFVRRGIHTNEKDHATEYSSWRCGRCLADCNRLAGCRWPSAGARW